MPDANSVATVAAWRQVDIELTAAAEHADPYGQVDVWADFVSETGEVLRRPAFWDGGRAWRIRFAPPAGSRHWEWATSASVGDSGLAGLRGVLTVAWSNLRAGGTMGVVYGAASLWQWVLRPNEPGHVDYFLAPGCGWGEALDFPGSTCVGMVGRILAGLPITDMRPGWRDVLAARCLIVPGTLFVNYSATGAPLLPIADRPLPRSYRIVDPRSGLVLERRRRAEENQPLPDTGNGPRVTILVDEASHAAAHLTEAVPT